MLGGDNMSKMDIYKMEHPIDVSTFLYKFMRAIKSDNIIDIYFNTNKAYPAACVPISGIIDTYKNSGYKIYCHYTLESYLSNIHFDRPYKVKEHYDSLAFPFSKIWKFSDFDEVTRLVNAYLDEVSALIPCSRGLIEGLEWSLNETMDNVLQHSMGGEGYMMGVVHQTTKYILFSIFDNGQGIFNSLKDSVYHPRTSIDAISLAIQEGKTRDKKIGQGNGLWGLNNIILSNNGKLEITSHGSSLMVKNDGTVKKFNDLPYISSKKATTTVNISFNYENDISVSEALGGYIPSNIPYEDKLDDKNCLKFLVADETTGYGTRIAGSRLRNKVLNYFERIDSPKTIEIDFSGVSMISSSFADEFIGKLISEIGFFRFTKLISLTGVSDVIEPIINRSVSQRMAQMYPVG